MTKNDDQPRPEPFCGELDPADLGRGTDVADDANHKQIAQAVVEDHPDVPSGR